MQEGDKSHALKMSTSPMPQLIVACCALLLCAGSSFFVTHDELIQPLHGLPQPRAWARQTGSSGCSWRQLCASPGRIGAPRPHAPPSAKEKGFFLNDTATTEIYTLLLHDALPI